MFYYVNKLISLQESWFTIPVFGQLSHLYPRVVFVIVVVLHPPAAVGFGYVLLYLPDGAEDHLANGATVQGGTSGLGTLFVDIKIKVLPQYKFLLLKQSSYFNVNKEVVLDQMYHPVVSRHRRVQERLLHISLTLPLLQGDSHFVVRRV